VGGREKRTSFNSREEGVWKLVKMSRSQAGRDILSGQKRSLQKREKDTEAYAHLLAKKKGGALGGKRGKSYLAS